MNERWGSESCLERGYLLGKKGTTEFDTEKMSEATDKFIEYCLDNPTAKALDVMGKFIK